MNHFIAFFIDSACPRGPDLASFRDLQTRLAQVPLYTRKQQLVKQLAPEAVAAFQYFVSHLPEIPSQIETVQIIINYFQYRHKARLALDPNTAKQLAWQLLFAYIHNSPFVQNELTATENVRDFKNFLFRYFSVFLNAIYEHWDRYIDSLQPKSPTSVLQFCIEHYTKFDESLQGRENNTFIISQEDFDTLITTAFYHRTLYVRKSLETSLELSPLILPAEAEAALEKYLFQSEQALALALYRAQKKADRTAELNPQQLLAAVADIHIITTSTPEKLLSDILTRGLPSLISNLLDTRSSVTDLQNASVRVPRILQTQRFIQAQIAELCPVAQVIDNKLAFLQALSATLLEPTTNLYTLYNLTKQYPACLDSSTEKVCINIYHQAILYLSSRDPEESDFLNRVIKYEEGASEHFEKLGNNFNIQHMHRVLMHCDDDTKAKILTYYSAYIRYKCKEHAHRLPNPYKVSEEILFQQIVDYFLNIAYKDDLDINYEFARIIHAREDLIKPDMDTNITKALQTLDDDPKDDGAYPRIVIPDDGRAAYILAPYSLKGKKSAVVLGEGANGMILLYRKAYLIQDAEGRWIRDPSKLEMDVALKLDKVGSEPPFKEQWLVTNFTGESVDAHVHYFTIQNDVTYRFEMEVPLILGQALSSEKPPSVTETWEILYKVLLRIKYLYEQHHVIHCDLNWHNIMKEGPYIHLTDFAEIKNLPAAKNTRCSSPADLTASWILSALKSHLDCFSIRPRAYIRFTSEFSLETTLYTLGADMMALHKWRQLSSNRLTVAENYVFICSNPYSTDQMRDQAYLNLGQQVTIPSEFPKVRETENGELELFYFLLEKLLFKCPNEAPYCPPNYLDELINTCRKHLSPASPAKTMSPAVRAYS